MPVALVNVRRHRVTEAVAVTAAETRAAVLDAVAVVHVVGNLHTTRAGDDVIGAKQTHTKRTYLTFIVANVYYICDLHVGVAEQRLQNAPT